MLQRDRSVSAITAGFLAVLISYAGPLLIYLQAAQSSTLSLAIPLVVVSLSGRYLPGMAILRAAGYPTTAKPIMIGTGLASLAMACFGGFTIVLAAITAALCTGRDAHEDPGKRYIAGIANGVFYIAGGCMVGTILWLFAALPPAITANVTNAVMDVEHREAAILTFLVTSSGMAFLGLGSAFWGVVIGSLAHWLWQPRSQA